MCRYPKWKCLLLWRETTEDLYAQKLELNICAAEGGVLYGEGQGIVATKDSQGMATWSGQG
jgi:hypothetical protein